MENQKPIDINSNTLQFFEDTIVYLQRTFDSFDIELLNIEYNNLNFFEILFAYSYDNQNFSQFKSKEEFELPSDFESVKLPIYISILFKKIKIIPHEQLNTLYPAQNVDSILKYINVNSITYNNEKIEGITYQSIFSLINQYPRWNFYDNQKPIIDRWLAQCNAIAEMYGHSCIYFKTEPIESETVHTFANHVVRNVVNIKKINILAPNNELPQDRNIYSEWDMPLQDDFVIHVVKEKFEIAFGENIVPSEKDYLFLPIINKFFRVASMQPKNGFMGKIGWWEVFLAKYEEDDCVRIDDQLKSITSGIPEFEEALDGLHDLSDIVEDSESTPLLPDNSDIFQQIRDFKSDTINEKHKIDKLTADEKKIPTQNHTNKLKDSTFYVSLKETEKIRESYDRRLKIVSVNPDQSSFPITMYDNSSVDKRVVALNYKLSDYTTKNKNSTIISENESFKFSFNFVLINRFVGEIFDLLDNDGNFSQFTIRLNRTNFELIDNRKQKTFLVNYKFETKELYHILIEYFNVRNKQQITIKIFELDNKEKSLIFQDIYINVDELDVNSGANLDISFPVNYIQMFGGNFYSSEVSIDINNKNIFKDYVNPLLEMKQV